MNSILQSHDTFRIHVTAATPAAPLAILSIASILGIEPQQVADRLSLLPTVLADNVPPPVARRVSALLTAVGMQVRLDPTLSMTAGSTMLDVALQPVGAVSARLADRIALATGLTRLDAETGLAGPEGLVLHGLADRQVAGLRHDLCRDPSLRLVTSSVPTALYDAFQRPGRTRPADDLRRLGLGHDPHSGAIAASMNGPTAEHLARRCGDSVLIVNREFQRFDLCLHAAPGLSRSELEGFLATRPSIPGRPSPDRGRLVDRDLSYRAMVQFHADYAAIGVEVVAELRGLVPARGKNL